MADTWTLTLKLELDPPQGSPQEEEHDPAGGYTLCEIIEGREELSALYSYELLVNTLNPCDCVQERRLLGRRARVEVLHGDVVLQRVQGIIMSVESSKEDKPDAGYDANLVWYKWVLRPEFAKACYSRNRLVFSKSEFQETDRASGEKLLEAIAARWNTPLRISKAARGRMPDFIQLVQNDESDYDFFTRVLSAWGLGYCWDMGGSREALCVLDMAAPDREFFLREDPPEGGDKEFVLNDMVEQSSQSVLWRANYGMQDADRVQVENYDRPVAGSRPILSLHDESWDQVQDARTPYGSALYTATHDNGLSCNGRYAYAPATAEAMQAIAPGRKARWAQGNAQCDSTEFYQTQLTIRATKSKWLATIKGRCPAEGAGLGVLPRPVRLNHSPDLLADALIAGEPWPEPRLRPFMAVVEDEADYPGAPGRNFCRVREITGGTLTEDAASTRLGNALWVEMGSPFADADSGLLARPRKGNVLFCLDRGDMGIPVVLSAMFRGSNKAPLSALKAMDRQKRTALDDIRDYSAVTLRNRTHTPERTYSSEAVQEKLRKELKADMEARGENYTAPAGNLPSPATDEGVDHPEELTRPLSVHELAKGKYAFNQIQLVARDNGVKPVEQNKDVSNTYLASGIIETVAGFFTEADMSTGYIMANTAKAAQDIYNAPVTRPHFEGINMYSAKDVLLQSADHQMVNAGGEIVLTAAQGITLRVGKSSIRITEAGVELVSGCGLVDNPGAHQAYRCEGEAQATHTMSASSGTLLGGRVWIDTSGVNTKGPYISNTAVNVFAASTFLGSTLTISDFKAKLYAPTTTIVGGAAVCDSILSGMTQAVFGSMDIMTAASGSETWYATTLQDGWKVYGPEWSDFVGSCGSAVYKALLHGTGCIGMFDKLKSLASVTGSMVKMEPDAMTISSNQLWSYQNHVTETNTPLAGFVAMGERAGTSSGLKSLSGTLASLGDGASFGISGALAAVGAAVGTLAGGMAGNALAERGGEDSFTEKENPAKPSFRNKGLSAGGAAIGGVLGSVGLFIAGIGTMLATKALPKLVKGIANLLFLGKRDMAWGVEKVMELRETQTKVQKKVQALDDSLLAVNTKDSALKKDMLTVLDATTTVSMKNKAVDASTAMLSARNEAVNDNDISVVNSRVLSVNTQTAGITTDNGTEIHL